MSIALALMGCVVRTEEPPAGDGTVEVGWEVGSQGCEAAGVVDVVVSVGSTSETFPCDEGRGALEVPSGRHVVLLEGLDPQGAVRYAGETSVDVGPDELVAAPTVVLSALPADLTVSWYFDNGRLCSANGVESIEVRVFEDDYVVDEVTAACDDGSATIEALIAGTYDVSLLARDAQDQGAWSAFEVVDLGKGDHVAMEIELLAER